MEFIKWLNQDNKEILLKTINTWWEEEKAPEALYYAKVATLYKKGETSRAENYRPISLPSGFSKIYMMLIRTRLQREVEDIVLKAQHGFRPAKSTAHAIYLIRRIQDYAETTRGSLYMTLLDWEKAFDKVDHDALGMALERLGSDKKSSQHSGMGMTKPPFYVEDEFGRLGNTKTKIGNQTGMPAFTIPIRSGHDMHRG